MTPERKVRNVHWKFASRNVDDDFHTDIVFLRVSTRGMKDYCAHSYSKVALHYRYFTGEFYYPDSEAHQICSALIEKLIQAPKWGHRMNGDIVARAVQLERVWKKYQKYRTLAGLATNEMVGLYKRQLDAQQRLYAVAWIPEVLQDEPYGLTYHLRRYLASRQVPSEEMDRVLSILGSRHDASVYKKQEMRLIELATQIGASSQVLALFNEPMRYTRLSLPAKVNRAILTLVDEFGYLGYHGYDCREPYSYEHYLGRLRDLVLNPGLIDAMLKTMEPYAELRNMYERTVERFRIDPVHTELFQVYGDFGATKARRRLAQLRNFHFLDMLLAEVSLRLGVPEKYLRFMTPDEIIKAIEHQGEIPTTVDDRCTEMLFVVDKDKEYIWTNPVASQLAGAIANGPIIPYSNVLGGSMACAGHAKGRALLITRSSDQHTRYFSEPRVLVSIEADPDLVPIMRQMAAIVTDQGGITCHAAIMAREFNVPCVVGTQYATQVIRNGDLLEVDADHGRVTILERAANDEH